MHDQIHILKGLVGKAKPLKYTRRGADEMEEVKKVVWREIDCIQLR